MNYYVPVTSNKKKFPDNFLIESKSGKVVSSLRFNYVIPVPPKCLNRKVIREEKDEKYRRLLQQELTYCRNHPSEIERMALRTYERVIRKLNPGLVHNACDFPLLEEACMRYEK